MLNSVRFLVLGLTLFALPLNSLAGKAPTSHCDERLDPRNTGVISINGSNRRPSTLEDLFGDTGDSFQAAIGFLTLEGRPGNPANRGFGLAIDDMFVEWVEVALNPDTTSCLDGQCAAIGAPSIDVFQGTTALPVSLLDASPYGHACVSGPNSGLRCDSANVNADCPSGVCLPTKNDCNLNGIFNEIGVDSDNCDSGKGDTRLDVVARATSDADTTGEIIVLNQVSVGSPEYRGFVTISALGESEGVLFVKQQGQDAPTVTITYKDENDGSGRLCKNSVVPEQQGRVQAEVDVNLALCDVQVVGTSFTDNGDGDIFADSSETILLDVDVRNDCGFPLTHCIARLSSNSEAVECIKNGTLALGTLEPETIVSSSGSFELKLHDTLADRTTQGLGPNDPLEAYFNVAISCDQIDGLTSPQDFSMQFDLNLNDDGQVPTVWVENFEGGDGGGDPFAGTAFEAQNNDRGIPGSDNAEGLVNGDGWRCQYTDPDWVNSASYNQDTGLDCYPAVNLAHANAVFWQIDGLGVAGTPDGGRAKEGTRSMYYGIFLNAPDDDFTTPMATVEAAGTNLLVNLGVDSPTLSFWHQISLSDHRTIQAPDRRSADRGVLQIKLFDQGGAETSPWMNLQAIQNGYDEQNADNFFNCQFDPIDDGNTEDDFFDPTDPEREHGPSSTCYPEFTWAWMGSTTGVFDVANVGHATTPPAGSDAPSLGVGTWIETVVDLSEFRGRRAKLRFIVTSIKAGPPGFELFWSDSSEGDDGWWIDDILIDEVLGAPASIVSDDYVLGTCSSDTSTPCIAQCRFSGLTCQNDDQCGVDETCVAPCPPPQTCLPVPPACGETCTAVTANAFLTPADQLNPGSVATAAPGQALTINGAARVDVGTGAAPSEADSCLSGHLQFQYCRDGDPLGGGPTLPDGDCDDPEDLLIRAWSENAVLPVAPQESASYTMQVRCSTKHDCADSEVVGVDVTCPGGANALGLESLVAVFNEVASQMQLSWRGSPLDVDVWTSAAFTNSSGLASYPGSTFFLSGVNSVNLDSIAPAPDQTIGILVKADGALNTIPLGFFCNSRTWRSGGSFEIPESGFAGVTSLGRDISIGDPTP